MTRRATPLLGAFVAAVILIVPLLEPSTSASAGKGITMGRVHETFQPEDGKIFVLIIGNDAREGNPDRSRADAIHIAGVNTRTMRGGILNFPRDSYVNIPGHGSAKMNEALYRGGPELMARTLENLTGIRIDYWVMVGFEGFRKIIKDVGGVTMTMPFDIYDPRGSGANLKKGRQPLGAEKSLQFVRTRHSFPNGDIDRSTNQGKYLLALLKELRADVSKDPSSLIKWTTATRRHARLDASVEEIFRLAILTSQMKAGRVKNVTVPVRIGSVGAASVVFIQPSASSIYARFRQKGSL